MLERPLRPGVKGGLESIKTGELGTGRRLSGQARSKVKSTNQQQQQQQPGTSGEAEETRTRLRHHLDIGMGERKESSSLTAFWNGPLHAKARERYHDHSLGKG